MSPVELMPKYNHDAEQAILGAVLIDPAVFNLTVEYVTATDFYRSAHQKIFQAMHALVDQNEPIDTITLTATLEQRGELESIGGRGYLAELVSSVGSSSNVRHHCLLVRDIRKVRDLRHLGMELTRKTEEPLEVVSSLITWAEQSLFSLAHGDGGVGFQSILQIMIESVEYADKVSKNPAHIIGIPSGIQALDQLTSGWQSSDLVIIGARPSMGKTAFALNLMTYATKQGYGAGMFSLEMSKQQLGLRLLSSEAQVDSHAIKTGQLSQGSFGAIAKAAARLENLPMWIDDAGEQTISTIRAKARRLKAQHDIRMILVDYLQLMGGSGNEESRQQEVSGIARGLKLLAKELDVVVVALSQLNRGLENRMDKRPQLSDLRESGAIEQDADVVCFLYRDEVYTPDSPDRGIAEILVRKHRNGPIGDARVSWTEYTASFGNLTGGMA